MLRTATYVPFICVSLMMVSTAQSSTVQFDISSTFNYDAIGTALELSANVPGPDPDNPNNWIRQGIGDHNIDNSRHYTNQGSVSSGTALPDDGVVGPYQISTLFDNGTDGLSKVDNSLAIIMNNSSPTIMNEMIALPVHQQGQYQSINMLFVTSRGGEHPNYRSWIVAHYSDGTDEIIVDTGLSSTGVDGSFGGRLQSATYTSTFENQAPGDFGTVIGVQPVLVMDQLASQSGSSQSLRGGTAVMWEFDTAIPVDPTKTLEALELNLRRSGSSRNQSIWVFGVNGELAPTSDLTIVPLPPAVWGGLALLGMVIARHHRRSTAEGVDEVR